jgi:mRNA-degrading endonuclease HigB of HigAB toxin-antitoxin module
MADKRLFPRLKKLFSTDVVIRNVGGNQLRVMDINSIQSVL